MIAWETGAALCAALVAAVLAWEWLSRRRPGRGRRLSEEDWECLTLDDVRARGDVDSWIVHAARLDVPLDASSLISAGSTSSTFRGRARAPPMHLRTRRPQAGRSTLGADDDGSETVAVALKIFRRHPLHASSRAFLAELVSLTSIHHVNIVAFLGVADVGGRAAILTEYLGGGNLVMYQVVEPLSETEAFMVMAQVSSAMDYLEFKALVHMRLQARNVLVSEESGWLLAKVCEFGSAAQSTQRRRQSRHGPPSPLHGADELGPCEYALDAWTPPECFVPGALPASPMDVWCFGVLIWEIASPGEVPFRGASGSPSWQLSRPARATHWMWEMATWCMALEPELRPTFARLHRQLTAMAGSFGLSHQVRSVGGFYVE